MSARSTSSTRGSAREGGGGGAPSSANSNNASVYERMVELEKELRIRDSHLDQLTHEKKALEKVSKNKETSLITLTNELIEAKKHISKLELDVATKNEESKQLFEKKSAYTQQLLNAETVKSKEIEAIREGKSGVPIELYHHVIRLENDLHDRDRVVSFIKSFIFDQSHHTLLMYFTLK